MHTNTRKNIMRKCIIVGAGDFFGMPFKPEKEDYIIAADGGYENLKKEGIKPDLIVGDFDSMHIEGINGSTGDVRNLDIFDDADRAEYIHHLKELRYEGIETRAIDPIKNDPDMLACIRIGLEMGYREFHIMGGTGKRIDHSIANLQILAFLAERGCRAYLYSAFQITTAIRNTSLHFPASMKGYFSVFSYSEKSLGVTEKGFKYIINDVTLNNLTPTGLSNEFVGTEAEISVKNGTLILVYEQSHQIS